MCHFICNHSYFGNVVLVCIMVSSAMLAAEDPLNSNSERNKVTILQFSVVRYDYLLNISAPVI